MTDNELFNLCKAVYEKTGWDADSLRWHYGGDDERFPKAIHPLYTSDYILEKLPKMFVADHDDGEGEFWLALFPDKDHWTACYPLLSAEYHIRHSVHADIPLKALLKLTLALHEAGELK